MDFFVLAEFVAFPRKVLPHIIKTVVKFKLTNEKIKRVRPLGAVVLVASKKWFIAWLYAIFFRLIDGRHSKRRKTLANAYNM